MALPPPSVESEQLAVLRLLEAGKVTAEEAVRLLQVVGRADDRPLSARFRGSEAAYAFEETVEGVIEVGEPVELDLRGAHGSIQLRAVDGASARVTVHAKVRGAASEDEARAIAGQLVVNIDRRLVGVRLREGLVEWPRGLAVSIEALLPGEADWRGSAKGSHGAIAAEGLTLSSAELSTSHGAVRLHSCGGTDVSVRTSHGAIEVRGNAVHRLRLATSHGSVRLLGGSADGLRVTTSHGPIEAEDLRGQVELRTSHAPVHVAIAHDAGSTSVDAETSHGRVEVRVPERLALDIHAATSRGSVEAYGFGPPEASGDRRQRLVWRSEDWESAPHRARLDLRTSNAGIRVARAAT